MRQEKDIRTMLAQAEQNHKEIAAKLNNFMEIEKLGKLSKDYFVTKGWIDALNWALTADFKKVERKVCQFTGVLEKCDGACGQCEVRENLPSTSIFADAGGK